MGRSIARRKNAPIRAKKPLKANRGLLAARKSGIATARFSG
jgi:hypothetical protein